MYIIYKLWQIRNNAGTIATIRLDRGSFTDYNAAEQEAERLMDRLSTFEVEELHLNKEQFNDYLAAKTRYAEKD